MSTHIAKLRTQHQPLPAGATLIGWIDRHPADKVGFGAAVLRWAATQTESAWDGCTIRSLPNRWRERVTFEPRK